MKMKYPTPSAVCGHTEGEADALTEKIIIQGMSVQDAIDSLDYSGYQYDMGSIDVIAGDKNNTLR